MCGRGERASGGWAGRAPPRVITAGELGWGFCLWDCMHTLVGAPLQTLVERDLSALELDLKNNQGQTCRADSLHQRTLLTYIFVRQKTVAFQIMSPQ